VAYGLGYFVAASIGAASASIIMSSPDGVLWTARVGTNNKAYNGIAHGNGLFVAAGNDGVNSSFLSSRGGVEGVWLDTAFATLRVWTAITYGKGLFVAVSEAAATTVTTSPDGINWSNQISVAGNDWRGVTFGNSLFVAVASSGVGNRVMTSPDGVVWTARVSAVDNDWRAVAYGNGLFVAVANSGAGNRVMTSPDGVNWTARASAADSNWRAVTFGAGLFVAVADAGADGRVMTSPDGINWTMRPVIAGMELRGVAYGNDVFAAVDFDNTTAAGTQAVSSGIQNVSAAPDNNIEQGGRTLRGDLAADSTNTATVGAVTINKTSGRVNIAALGVAVVVTNSLVTAASHVIAWMSSADATGRVISVVPAAGSFTINTVGVTAQASFDFLVLNPAPN
jgi:hypothetical protein